MVSSCTHCKTAFTREFVDFIIEDFNKPWVRLIDIDTHHCQVCGKELRFQRINDMYYVLDKDGNQEHLDARDLDIIKPNN